MIRQMSYIALLLAMCSLPTTAQVSSENYVQTTARISDTQSLSTIQYYDGLGRPTTKVTQGVTPQKENLVILQEYDGLGRENKTWLPVTSSSAYLNASDVASQSQRQYGDSRGYKTFVYEGSPLNRVSRLEGAGEAWSGHPVKTEYLVNASSSPLNCKYYRVSMQGVLQDKGYYPEGRLYVTKTTDEDGHVQYEFKNMAGNVILRRTMTGSNESADTYYIYDYRGNLAFVLPPNYQDEPSLSLYAYQYQYDGRNNCTYKKLPGCEPVYMRYNRANRLSFMQDGDLRKQGLWKFYVYDKLGRLVVTGTTASVSDVSESYTYAQYTGSGSLDGYALYGANTPEKALYNGNIAAMSWQVASRALQGYQLEYNNQSMLTDAKYGEGQSLENNKERYNEHLSYDKMGNIQSLLRYGLRDDSKYGLIDNLDYTYNGNQLTKVDDAVKGPYYAGAFHFVDGARASVEYTYDANGNMVKDLNKGISTIQYDINNEPRTISYSDGRNASYVYDAEGRKHSVSYNLTAMTSSQPQLSVMQSQDAVSANATNGQKTISYCGNIIYDGDETMVLNAVGYSLYDKSGNLSFHYYLKDHLGDNRVVMSEGGTVEQMNDYYPTGALMGSSMGGDKQRYKYNGKELDRLNGVDWYDYGARFYDGAILRWNGVDKLCEIMPAFNGYNYCLGNPLLLIDRDGMRPSKSEAALIASHVYGDNIELKGGWQLYDHIYKRKNGLQYGLYFRELPNGKMDYVLAFAGTNSWKDLQEDINQAMGTFNIPQFGNAQKIGEQFKKEFENGDRTFVGHSLGGGLAATASLTTGIPAITFNPAALSKNTKMLLNIANKESNQIVNYIVDGEFVDKLQRQAGLIPDGKIIRISNKKSNNSYMFNKHKIKIIIDIFK